MSSKGGLRRPAEFSSTEELADRLHRLQERRRQCGAVPLHLRCVPTGTGVSQGTPQREYRRYRPRTETLTSATLMLAPEVVELVGLVQLHTAFGNAPPTATSRIKKNPWSTTSFQ